MMKYPQDLGFRATLSESTKARSTAHTFRAALLAMLALASTSACAAADGRDMFSEKEQIALDALKHVNFGTGTRYLTKFRSENYVVRYQYKEKCLTASAESLLISAFNSRLDVLSGSPSGFRADMNCFSNNIVGKFSNLGSPTILDINLTKRVNTRARQRAERTIYQGESCNLYVQPATSRFGNRFLQSDLLQAEFFFEPHVAFTLTSDQNKHFLLSEQYIEHTPCMIAIVAMENGFNGYLALSQDMFLNQLKLLEAEESDHRWVPQRKLGRKVGAIFRYSREIDAHFRLKNETVDEQSFDDFIYDRKNSEYFLGYFFNTIEI